MLTKTAMFDSRPMLTGTCEWCGKDCSPDYATCSLSCEAQLRRLEASQGRTVIRAIKRWRLKPNHAIRSEMLTELSLKIDRYLRQDQRRREKMNAERRKAEAEANPEEES